MPNRCLLVMDHTSSELSLVDLTAALDACMRANPPTDKEHRLHPDANAMGDPFAIMVLGRLSTLDRALVKLQALEAFDRWKVPASPAKI
jgi:hypothetical protein